MYQTSSKYPIAINVSLLILFLIFNYGDIYIFKNTFLLKCVLILNNYHVMIRNDNSLHEVENMACVRINNGCKIRNLMN